MVVKGVDGEGAHDHLASDPGLRSRSRRIRGGGEERVRVVLVLDVEELFAPVPCPIGHAAGTARAVGQEPGVASTRRPRTQNSFPSGSARTTQGVAPWPMSTG